MLLRAKAGEVAMFGMMRDGVMNGPMTWGMGIGMGLVVIVLALGAAALVKCFRDVAMEGILL